MLIKTIPVGMYQANSYIIMDEETKDCIVVDPGEEALKIENAIENLEAKPKMILLTHGHFDHVGAVKALSEKYDIPFYISKNDADMIEKKVDVFGTIPKTYRYIKDGEVLDFSKNYKVKCIETPGHTPGGLCFLIENCLFTGDTLFRESIGRSDFVGGNLSSLLKSIKEKLLPLGDDIVVYPGHGPSTTIKHEKERNPFLAGDFYVY